MAKCNTFYIYMKLCVLFIKIKGFKMSIMVKNVQSMLEKFEDTIERWAQKFL